MKRDPISIRQAFNFAWPIYKKRFGLFTAVLLTISGAWVALEIVVIAGQRLGILLWVAMHLAFLIFVAGVEVGLIQLCLALYDGADPVFADTFKHLALGPTFLAGQVLYLLTAVIGLPLLVIPGAYPGLRYALFGFCMAGGETNLVRSFKRSAILSAGVNIYLFSVLAALFVLNVLGASLLGLGLFITVPVSVLMMTAVYRGLNTVDR